MEIDIQSIALLGAEAEIKALEAEIAERTQRVDALRAFLTMPLTPGQFVVHAYAPETKAAESAASINGDGSRWSPKERAAISKRMKAWHAKRRAGLVKGKKRRWSKAARAAVSVRMKAWHAQNKPA